MSSLRGRSRRMRKLVVIPGALAEDARVVVVPGLFPEDAKFVVIPGPHPVSSDAEPGICFRANRSHHLVAALVKQPAIYILTNKPGGVLYIGVTSDLVKRVWQHRSDAVEGFSQRYRLHELVYFEPYESMVEAIEREKELKKWRRAWKVTLIEKHNPKWRDLWIDLTG